MRPRRIWNLLCIFIFRMLCRYEGAGPVLLKWPNVFVSVDQGTLHGTLSGYPEQTQGEPGWEWQHSLLNSFVTHVAVWVLVHGINSYTLYCVSLHNSKRWRN